MLLEDWKDEFLELLVMIERILALKRPDECIPAVSVPESPAPGSQIGSMSLQSFVLVKLVLDLVGM